MDPIPRPTPIRDIDVVAGPEEAPRRDAQPMDSPVISNRNRLGTSLAGYLLRGVALAAALCSMTSCLVTDPVDFPQEENFPPSIVSAARAREMGVALDQIIRVVVPPDRSGELVIPVEVRDPNVEQDLDYIWLLDFRADLSVNVLNDLEDDSTLFGIENGPEVRDLELNVPLRELGSTGSCHKIELLVSSQFSSVVNPREPEQPGDIAQAVWWVHLTDAENTEVDMGLCP